MISKINRLSRQEIVVRLKKSQMFHSPLFTIKIANQNNGRGFKAAVTISAKVAKKAVDRNRLRRRTHDIISSLAQKIKPTLIFQLIVKKPTTGLNYKQLSVAIIEFFRKTGVI